MSQEITDEEYFLYYSQFFPKDDIIKFLSYNGEVPLDRRETTFCLKGDIFTRYQQFDNFSASRFPNIRRIEIGPVYSAPMAKRHLNPEDFKPVEHELTFDIDMSDYDEVRTCCSGTNICPRCWHFMSSALIFLTEILTKNFGFKHILPVFSGRRGIHIWVCDEKARKLMPSVRKAIVNYLDLLNIVRSSPNPKCPLLDQIFPLIHRQFLNFILPGQRVLTEKKLILKITDILKSTPFLSNFNSAVQKMSKSSLDPIDIWKQELGQCFEKPIYKRIIVELTYPRLDVNVTTIMNHLLKTPFSIHPSSGLLSLPIPPDQIQNFPCDWVPDIHALLDHQSDAIQIFQDAIKQFEEFQEKTVQILN